MPGAERANMESVGRAGLTYTPSELTDNRLQVRMGALALDGRTDRRMDGHCGQFSLPEQTLPVQLKTIFAGFLIQCTKLKGVQNS